jgi:hypothetical protein
LKASQEKFRRVLKRLEVWNYRCVVPRRCEAIGLGCFPYPFLSMASIAANFRLMCGSERRPSECSTQRFPAGTPHVGHCTEDNCLGVSSFFFVKIRMRFRAV